MRFYIDDKIKFPLHILNFYIIVDNFQNNTNFYEKIVLKDGRSRIKINKLFILKDKIL